MSNIVSAVNTTAMVLGYMVLPLLLAGLGWFFSVWHEAWRYKRRRQRQHDIEWDNLRSTWVFEMYQDRIPTSETPFGYYDRLDTDVLDFTVEQIYDYQKEFRNDVA